MNSLEMDSVVAAVVVAVVVHATSQTHQMDLFLEVVGLLEVCNHHRQYSFS